MEGFLQLFVLFKNICSMKITKIKIVNFDKILSICTFSQYSQCLKNIFDNILVIQYLPPNSPEDTGLI